MLLFSVLSGIIVACMVPFLFKLGKKAASLIISLVPLSLFLYYLFNFGITDNLGYYESLDFFPALGVNLNFVMDSYALIFALIITGIGTAVFFYSSYYLADNPYLDRFYIYILIFMASMLGIVTSDNMVIMFIFWELTSISSFMLIGFKHREEKSRYSAWQALLVTGSGALALLAGILLLYVISGKMNFSEINAIPLIIQASPLFLPAMFLVLGGAFTKSAQMPFHFWLPNAMEAPTPVSAYLHSATMVKAGIYLMARINPAFQGAIEWETTLTVFGGITMLFAAYMALKQTDLKRILAYTTLSVLGTLTLLIGIGTPLAMQAMVVYLIAHALYKGTLFLVAGAIDHGTGTRNIDEIGGLRKFMPITTIAATLAALSMAGVLPLFGFIGKELLYEATLEHSLFNYATFGAVFLAALFGVVAAGMSGIFPFFGKAKYPDSKPHEAPFTMTAGYVITAFLGLLLGLLPMIVSDNVAKAASDIYYNLPLAVGSSMHLSLWHGFNLVLILSLGTLALGIIILMFRNKIFPIIRNINLPEYLLPSKAYDVSTAILIASARLTTKVLQNGYLRNYITLILLTLLVLTSYSLFTFSDLSVISLYYPVTLYEIIIAVIISISAVLVIKSSGRLQAVAALGVVGIGVAMIFSIYGAPDLALTQYSIETLTVILFVLVIYKLPKFLDYSKFSHRLQDFFLATAVGLTMTILILMVTANELPSEFKDYYGQTSYILGKGRNIVNVILVDYRALDTLGEIVVLSLAALGVFALLKLKKDDGDSI